MENTALITGASSGIGLEFSKIHASKGGDLVLVARSEDKLKALAEELKNEYDTNVLVIPLDLSTQDSAKKLYEKTSAEGVAVKYLINNAGFGNYEDFKDSNWQKELAMMNLNMITLTALCKFYLTEMVSAGGGKILNLASTASFQPGPGMAVYYASKAYVLHFSEAINYELKDEDVTVTALCPGPTVSGFQSAADLDESDLFNNQKLPAAAEVAEYGYNAMLKGKAVVIHGFKNYALANSVRFMPRKAVLKIVDSIQN